MSLRFLLPFPSARLSKRRYRLALAAMLLAGTSLGWSRLSAAADAVPPITPPMSAMGAYLAGADAMHQSDYPSAALFLTAALKADPDNVDLLRNLVLVTIGQGKQDEAVQLARRLAAQEQQSPIANLVLALGNIHDGKLKEANAALDGLPRTGINNLLLPLMRGWVAAGQKDQQGAYDALKPLGDVGSFSGLYTMHRALIAEMLGDTATAADAYKLALTSEPTPSWRTVALVGGFYERQGDTASAKALYDDFQAHNPDSSLLEPAFARLKSGQKPSLSASSTAQGIAEALFDVTTVIQRERPGSELALVYTRLAIWMRPDSAVIQMLLGDVLEAEGRGPEAIAIYKGIDPASPFGWTAQQHVALGQDAEGDTEGAIAAFKAMSAQHPERIDALADLADLLRSHQRFAEAVTVYDQAIAKISAVDKRHWSLFFDRGIAEDRSNQKEKAEADLLHALELQPEQPYVLNYLGYSWIDEGKNLDRAKQMIERAVALRPQDGEIVDSLGWAYFQLGDFDQAANNLEHAVELRPQDATINDHLGDAYWRVGRKIEAQFQWRRSLTLDPEDDLRATIGKKLTNGLPAAAPQTQPTAAKP